MTIVYLTPAELEAVALSASTEQSRYYLCGVSIEPYGDIAGMIATDGHRMSSINARIKEAVPADSFIFDSNDIKKSLQMAKAEAKTLRRHSPLKVVIRITKDGLELVVDICLADCENNIGQVVASFPTKAIDGRYPDWRRILPSGEASGCAIAFNGTYMADFAKAAKILGSKKQTISMITYGNESAIEIKLRQDNFLGVLMPVRF